MKRIRILCVDHDDAVLETRCAVLVDAGYDAEWVGFAEAEARFQQQPVDLLVLPSRLSNPDKIRILRAKGRARVILLEPFTMPVDLLRTVEEQVLLIRNGLRIAGTD